jgi:hypothetical protein
MPSHHRQPPPNRHSPLIFLRTSVAQRPQQPIAQPGARMHWAHLQQPAAKVPQPLLAGKGAALAVTNFLWID